MSFLSCDIQSVRQIGQNFVVFLQENNAAGTERGVGEAVLLSDRTGCMAVLDAVMANQVFLAVFQ